MFSAKTRQKLTKDSSDFWVSQQLKETLSTARTHESVMWRKMPPVLLPYQSRYFNAAGQHKVIVVEKSRRIGISWADAAISALDASRIDGCNTYFVSYNKEGTEQYILDVAFWAKHYQLAASAIEQDILQDEQKDVLIYRIRFASGYQVIALSSAPTNLRNKKGKIVIDEAAFHENLAELLKAATAILIWGKRSQLRIISTHNGVDNYFNQLCKKIRASELPYHLMKITFKDAIASGLCQRIFFINKQQWSPSAQNLWANDIYKTYGSTASEELDCEPMESGGGLLDLSYFRRYRALPHRFEYIVQSLDTASTNKETSANWAGLMIGIFEDEFYIFDAISDKFDYPSGKRTFASWALQHNPHFLLIEDKSTGTSLIQEYRLGISDPTTGRSRKFNIIPITPCGDKVTRMNIESGAVQAGRVWLPEAAPWLGNIELSFRGFPKGIVDPVDALSQFLSWVRGFTVEPNVAGGGSGGRTLIWGSR